MADDAVIANNFANYFSQIYSCNNVDRAINLKHDYLSARENYQGFSTHNLVYDTELVSKVHVLLKLHRDKAPGIDGLMVEHLLYCHPVLPIILSKLFTLILQTSLIPSGFKRSYIVPIPKVKNFRSKALTCDDFRGIAIAPVISKLFEYYFLENYNSFLTSSDAQFGFKKHLGCSHAVYTVRNIVDYYVSNGTTVNLCALDVSKAFDKVNHNALYMQLMRRHIPVKLLDVIVNLFSNCTSCAKWNSVYSVCFDIVFGVRQGSVLSPILFALYIDYADKLGCRACHVIIYADDILLVAPSVSQLERLLHNCEKILEYLDMNINFGESKCLRIGPRNDSKCANIVIKDGRVISWAKHFVI